jgi:uncharacterized protein with GYD domain
MPFYMTQFSYDDDTWQNLTKNPEDREPVIREWCERNGAKLHGFWYAFGEYDGVLIIEAPDNATVAAILLAVAGSGAVEKLKTTVLMTTQEAVGAMRRAGGLGYRPPGTSA